MALTGDIIPNRRGPPASRNEFGYPLAPGELVYRGSLVGLNATGQVQRLQTAGTVVPLGLSNVNYNNVGSAVVGPTIVPMKGSWALTVPAANVSEIGAAVYASDDGTYTLTAGSLLQVGTLVGIENGQTFVQILGT